MIKKAVCGRPLILQSMKKVELLSPAGGYKTMVGAFNAGATAVYLGGSKFGARAYAENFDRDEVLDAIVYAHLHGKKIYMTVNTLVKETEFSQLYDFMLPYAEKKLDGVIVQDYGAARLIRQEFPDIELHASTQQTVTGIYGAWLLKDRGYTRVVPARELSLEEMRAIRERADIEVEAFIHGAMCYCYSGACLFSSVVGGRSGNRGRCAQPCRLPYRMESGGKEIYPLSLKDMNTIALIPELIEAGIDSFKIEGRMKKPEYSAGVTALYRKYIDMYYEDPKAKISVSEEDMETLRQLYQRTGISDGYYHRHNDKAMVTFDSPAYNATSEELLSEVHDKYLTSTLKHKCDLYCELVQGRKIRMTMSVQCGDDFIYEEVYGSEVQAASKRPMDEAGIRKQIAKLGNTAYEAENIDITIDDGGSGQGIFVAVSELNELRRQLTAKVDERISQSFTGSDAPKTDYSKVRAFTDYDYYNNNDCSDKYVRNRNLQVLVSTTQQLIAVINELENLSCVTSIFVDSNIFLSMDDAVRAMIRSASDGSKAEFYAVLPYITREEKWDGSREVISVAKKAADEGFTGILVRNIEQLQILKETGYKGRMLLDYGVYIWNKEAALELLDCNDTDSNFMIEGISVPYELNFREAGEMARALKKTVDLPISVNLYGYIPMMVSAGCVRKTTGACSGKMNELYSENTKIIDRMNNTLEVTCNCRSCYNIIWNALPTSQHRNLDRMLGESSFDSFRIDFTLENEDRCREILRYYDARISGRNALDVFSEGTYTTAHFKRGAE
jgi:putative protease